MKNFYKKILVITFFLGCAGLGILVFTNITVLSYDTDIYYSSDQVPTNTIALIFGGGIKNATEMSDMQYDRVLVGVNLYKQNKVQKLFLTGDDGAFHGDEITAMRELAVAEGVPTGDILADPHGYRTYESCYRESKYFGVTSTIAISQSFHLPRIRYLCENFGIKTIGLTADLRSYDSWWIQNGREWLARVKAWWQTEITKPFPSVYGKDLIDLSSFY